MNPPVLCVIQARYHSTRLPGKMLETLGNETLIARAWRIACQAFGSPNSVVALPMSDASSPLIPELRRINANWDATFPGEESDVLGRFHHVAHSLRWHPDTVIVRYTPDDPHKDPESLRRVARGERLPVEIGGEAFTLAMLDEVFARIGTGLSPSMYLDAQGGREHLTYALFPTHPPTPPAGRVWTIDTQEQLDAARRELVGHGANPWAPSRCIL